MALHMLILALQALRAALVVGLFLTAAFWLSELATRAGLARRAAAAVTRAAGGRGSAVYALLCLGCCCLTATVSLDGAVVFLAPVVAELGSRSGRLSRTLALGTIGVANAFSLALPQGNPTNVVVAARLGLSPAAFVSHLALPALLATVVCAAAPALAGRKALRSRLVVAPRATPLAPAERLAAAALIVAAVGEVAAPWLGVAPWWPLCTVAALTYAVTSRRGTAPSLDVPWRLTGWIAVLAAASAICSVAVPRWQAGTTPALLGVAAAASVAASLLNNLPASVVLSGLLGAAGPTAFAALAGLTVGALATRRGSVATIVALERCGCDERDAYARLWAPTALLALVAAVFSLRLTG